MDVHVAGRVSLRQLFVFMSLMAACFGLAVADEPSWTLAYFTSFVPGAYLATVLLRTSNPRLARRVLASIKLAAVGGTISSAAILLPLTVAHHLNSPHHLLALHEEVIVSLVAATIVGAGGGTLFGWLSAEIFAGWDRRRRWRLRREKYGDAGI
jgi:hypothetical protein